MSSNESGTSCTSSKESECFIGNRARSSYTLRGTQMTNSVRRISTNRNHMYINKYLLKERIGVGSFGTVRKCQDITTGKLFAMKILDKENLRSQFKFRRTKNNSVRCSTALDNVEQEIAIMKKLHHENVVSLIEVIDSENTMYLIMEYMPFGSIAKGSETIPKLERDEIEYKESDKYVLKLYVRDIVSGLSYLHSQRICHSDIKPENILIGNDGVLKLCDFGLSKFLMGESSRVFEMKDGTLPFQAPECLSESGDLRFSLFPTDIWALGVTLYQLKYGYLPFFSLDEEKLMEKILNDPVIIPDLEDKDFSQMIKAMLNKDPAKRITVEELCKHPWITDQGKLSDLVYNYDREVVSPDDREYAFAEYRDQSKKVVIDDNSPTKYKSDTGLCHQPQSITDERSSSSARNVACDDSYQEVPIHRVMSSRSSCTLNHNSRGEIIEDFNVTPHASKIDLSQRTKSFFRLSSIVDYSKVEPTIHKDLATELFESQSEASSSENVGITLLKPTIHKDLAPELFESQSEGSSSENVGITLLKQVRIVRCGPFSVKSRNTGRVK